MKPAAALVLACGACAPAAPPPEVSPPAPTMRLEGQPGTPPLTAEEVLDRACSADSDCGFDPTADRCGADPRFNRQPPLRDQGIVCWCDAEAHRCRTLRQPPVPCEGDEVCAVVDAPRPHLVRASAEHPHDPGKPCEPRAFRTTCERTNICTLWPLPCRGGAK